MHYLNSEKIKNEHTSFNLPLQLFVIMAIQYPDLQPFYQKVFNDTVSDKDITEDVEFARCFLEEWAGELLHPFGNDLHRENRLNSIFYSYLASQSLTFDWLAHALLFAQYQVVLRELRTILENMFYMYYLDVTYQDKKVEEKYEILENLESKGVKPHGKNVFKDSTYHDWKSSYKTYQDLCKFVHIHTKCSAKLALSIAREGFPESLDVKYDKESFLECIRAWKKIAKTSVDLAVTLCDTLDVEISQFNPDYFDKIW